MAVRLYVHRWIDGDPIVDIIDQYGVQVDSTSKQMSQSGADGYPTEPYVIIRVRGDAAALDQLEGYLPGTVHQISRYRGDKLLADIPPGTRKNIIDALNDRGVPLNWFSDCVTWRDFLTRLYKWVNQMSRFPPQIDDSETE